MTTAPQETQLRHWLRDRVHEQEKRIPADTKTLIPGTSKLQIYIATRPSMFPMVIVLFVVTWVIMILIAYNVIGT